MRAITDAREFSGALNRLGQLLPQSSIPALEGVYVRFSGGRCNLTATDLSTWLTVEIPAQGDDFAFVLTRAKRIAKACRRSSGEMSLELAETGEGRRRQLRLRLCCGARTGEFDALFPKDYPERPEVEADHTFTVNAAYLSARIGRVSYPVRYPMENVSTQRTSVQFCGSHIFSLDGCRLAWDTDEAVNFPEDFLVSAAPLAYLKAFGEQDVAVRLGKRLLEITGGALCLRLRRELAVPFQLHDAIPACFETEICISPKNFLEELDYLEKIVPASKVRALRFCGGRLLVEANGCRCSTEIQVEGVSHIEIGLHRSHLIEALRQFKTEPRVRMKLNSAISPVILEADGRNDRAMILPVRLKAPAAA